MAVFQLELNWIVITIIMMNIVKMKDLDWYFLSQNMTKYILRVNCKMTLI